MQNGSCRFSSAGSVFEIAKFGLCSDQLVFSVLNGKGLGTSAISRGRVPWLFVDCQEQP